MGRTRKRFNDKARSGQVSVEVGKNEEKVEVTINTGKEKYDDSNPLIVSGTKEKTTKIHPKVEVKAKQLSKKQRKKLEKVLERKKRKVNRAELLEKLGQVQAKPEELKLLTGTSATQTLGLKRLADDEQIERIIEKKSKITKVNNIRGSIKSNQPPSKRTRYESTSDSSEESCGEDVQFDLKDKADMTIEKGEVIETIEKGEVNETIEKDETDSKSLNLVQETSGGNQISNQTEGSFPPPANNIETVKKNIKDNKLKHNEPSCKPAAYVPVNRKPEIQAAREALPIFCEEQSVIEAINENPVVLIHGETGCGKTTQVPQFLYEAGFTQNNKIIGITEPRRIAAMSMAARVGEEMNAPEKVSYHIRYERTISKQTEIKFMTDGVLLKEIRHDFFLTKYSVIIIDEAHERSVFSDVLIGLLSRIVPIRAKRKDPLKLIIMSATIRVEDFMENPRLFKVQPFLIRLNSRQHRVHVHFNIQTPDDYVEAAYQKVCKIHRQLPGGAILVFLTGEKEIQRLCKMLRQTFPFKNKAEKHSKDATEDPASVKSPEVKRKKRKKTEDKSDTFCALPDINLDNYAIEPLDTENLQHQQSDDEDNETKSEHFIAKSFENSSPLYALPLYSVLPFQDQEKIFKPPPAGSRLCVVSTNVAETSITIPGLKYVVDSGRVKAKVYNSNNGGISKFEIVWCSKASANQRAGRCGRTEGGHCYRLYSSSVFEHDFPDFSLPEIQRIPVDDVLLQMKALGIDRVVEFPFPSPPEKEALMAAEKRLVSLGALQDLQKGASYKELSKWEYSAKVTTLGKAMARFPLSPRYAKMLLLSYKHDCIPHVVAIVCALTVPELFLTSTTTVENDDGEEVKVVQEGIKKIGAETGNSAQLGDIMILLRAVALFGESKHGVKFCLKYGIRYKAMTEIKKMWFQLVKEMNRAFPDNPTPVLMQISAPDDEKVEKIRKVVAACLIDHVAKKLSREETNDDKTLKNAYKCLDCEDPVFIHPSSSLFERLPEYIVYNEIVKTTKLYMKGVVEIEPEWLPAFSPNLCAFSAPQENPPPSYDTKKDKIYCTMGGTFGCWQWTIPPVSMEMPKGLLKYSWFCYFLLDGQVCNFIKTYKADLLSTPSVMLKSWAKLLPRTRYLLQAVISKEVDSKESLKKAWEQDPKYLLREFFEWLPVEKHLEVELKWPPPL